MNPSSSPYGKSTKTDKPYRKMSIFNSENPHISNANSPEVQCMLKGIKPREDILC
jgi:hypothetical protein